MAVAGLQLVEQMAITLAWTTMGALATMGAALALLIFTPLRASRAGASIRGGLKRVLSHLQGVQRDDLSALAAEVADSVRRDLDASERRQAAREQQLLERMAVELADARSDLATKIETMRAAVVSGGPVRQLEWTPQLVYRFWDGVGASRLNELSFAHLIRDDLTILFKRFVGKKSRVLDFGGGDGTLVRMLIRAGYQCAFHEPSPRRREQLEKDLSGNAKFLGAIAHVGVEKFDAVAMCEVIEHILDCDLDNILEAINRALKPGGILFLTTPYAEDLELNQTFCPVSGMRFHRWQHVRSITPETLLPLLRRHGFVRNWLGLVSFSQRKQLLDWMTSAEFATGRVSADRDADLVLPPHENLVLVCRKFADVEMSAAPSLPDGFARIDGSFALVKGACYSVELPTAGEAGDIESEPNRSNLLLLEDGWPLGSPHSMHDDIAARGRGAYSHWQNTLYFSASDNSDPNSNGRCYAFMMAPIGANKPVKRNAR